MVLFPLLGMFYTYLLYLQNIYVSQTKPVLFLPVLVYLYPYDNDYEVGLVLSLKRLCV